MVEAAAVEAAVVVVAAAINAAVATSVECDRMPWLLKRRRDRVQLVDFEGFCGECPSLSSKFFFFFSWYCSGCLTCTLRAWRPLVHP